MIHEFDDTLWRSVEAFAALKITEFNLEINMLRPRSKFGDEQVYVDSNRIGRIAGGASGLLTLNDGQKFRLDAHETTRKFNEVGRVKKIAEKGKVVGPRNGYPVVKDEPFERIKTDDNRLGVKIEYYED